MKMSESVIRSCVSVCCKPRAMVFLESKCSWNATFLTNRLLIPDHFCFDTLFPSTELEDSFSRCEEAEDSYLEDDLYNMFKFDPNFLNQSIYDRLVERMGNGDVLCSIFHVIANETDNIVATCSALYSARLTSLTELSCVVTPSNVENERLFGFILLCISLPFLASTFLIYTILPELKNLHGSMLRSYIACAFIAAVFETIPEPRLSQTYFYLKEMCYSYTYLAMFFWLNVMCFDIWWTFRSTQRSSKKFAIYSIYAWGMPILINGLHYYNIWANLIRGSLAVVLTFQAVPCITVFSNVCFFVLGSVEITLQKRNTARHLDDDESRRHNEQKQRFNVYLKLFSIMGVARIATWIIVWFRGVLPNCKWVIYLFCAVQLPAMLQGVFIFVTFVCNEKIKRLLSKRLGDLPSSRTRIPYELSILLILLVLVVYSVLGYRKMIVTRIVQPPL